MSCLFTRTDNSVNQYIKLFSLCTTVDGSGLIMTEDGNLNKEGEAIDKLDSEQSVDKEKPARNPGNTSILN